MAKKFCIALSAVLAAGVSTTALAQDDASAARPQRDDGLEAIIVTAERRTQNLQDVPISATVLTGETLDERGVRSVNDLQQVAPAVTINTYGRQTFVNIRGVGANRSAPTTSSGVAYYLDGVLIPNDKFIGFAFYDVAAIEVLRGPQGTLAGQNSTGGAIMIRTPEPEFDMVSGSLDMTLGNYDARRGVAALNFGGEDVALRIAAVHDERDSFTDNIGPSPSQPGNFNTDAARISLRMRGLDDRLTVNLRGEYFDARSDGNAVKNRFDTVTDDPFVIEEDAISYINQEGYRMSAEARFDVTDTVQVRGVISRQHGVTNDQTDGDRTATALPVPAGLPANGANRALYAGRVSRGRTEIDTSIYEINLLSTDSGPFQWVVGGFYLDNDSGVDLFRDNHHTVDFVASDSTIQERTKSTSKSLFGQANYFVTDALEVVLGGRYSWDRQVHNRLSIPGPPVVGPNIAIATSQEWTGKAALNYHLGDALVYLSAAKGYKAGGANTPTDSPNYQPETNFVYELGAKTELFNRHLRLNGDIFYSQYKDIQLASLEGGLPLTQNAGQGESWGVELEAQATFGGLDINFGGSYLDAQFSEDTCLNDTNSQLPSVQCSPGNRFVPEGDVLPYSPEWTLNGGVQYTLYVSDDVAVTPRLQWSHTGEQLATPFRSFYTIMPARDVFDARVTVSVSDRYTIEGFVQNLTDETYIATQIQNASSADGGFMYGAPRTFGVRLKAEFGG
ncbi:MAG: TonB-dependent receptor [Pseudomonadota bacterium]|nr:TonB-dependent receptor [Pseudomonadota bacterium]